MPDEVPECDKQLARQGDDHLLARAARFANPALKPSAPLRAIEIAVDVEF
jgi:hypothetical protein